jgi:NADH-quinone oxidoreductase subunit A
MAISLHLVVFLAVGIVFLAMPLVVGRLLRPFLPSTAKTTAYECGEEPVGTSDIRFDSRFYVVALLFIVFDVELALLFPWSAVYGTLVQLADHQLSDTARLVLTAQLVPGTAVGLDARTAYLAAALVFAEFVVFFGVLMVGFAYLWRRGDLEWVRGMVDAREVPSERKETSGTA